MRHLWRDTAAELQPLYHLLQPLSFAGPAFGAASWTHLLSAHDAAVQMIDTSIVRVHQHAACIATSDSPWGRSRGKRRTAFEAVVRVVHQAFPCEVLHQRRSRDAIDLLHVATE